MLIIFLTINNGDFGSMCQVLIEIYAKDKRKIGRHSSRIGIHRVELT